MDNNKDKKENLIIKDINKDINEVKVIMKDNIKNQLGNLESIENLKVQAKDLNDEAFAFKNDAQELRERSEGCCDKCNNCFKKCCTSIFCCSCTKNRSGACLKYIFIFSLLLLCVIGYFIAAIARCNSINLFC